MTTRIDSLKAKIEFKKREIELYALRTKHTEAQAHAQAMAELQLEKLQFRLEVLTTPTPTAPPVKAHFDLIKQFLTTVQFPPSRSLPLSTLLTLYVQSHPHPVTPLTPIIFNKILKSLGYISIRKNIPTTSQPRKMQNFICQPSQSPTPSCS